MSIYDTHKDIRSSRKNRPLLGGFLWKSSVMRTLYKLPSRFLRLGDANDGYAKPLVPREKYFSLEAMNKL